MIKKEYILGIDPSTSSTGYAVFDIQKKTVVAVGKIPAAADNPKEFFYLYNGLKKVFESYNIVRVSCETQFIGINKDTGIKTIRPTGIVLMLCGEFDVIDDNFEFAYPSSWRKYYFRPLSGKFNKKDTFNSVKNEYPQFVKTFTKDNDISDAIGIAVGAYKKHEEEYLS